MRRIIMAFFAMLLCFSLAIPAFATNAAFVPSITYKDGPEIEEATMDGENVEGCIVVTDIDDARNKNTDITQEERDLLLEVYKALNDGSMTLPLDGDYVIRELVDLSFEYDDCRIPEEHGHKDEKLKREGVTLTVDFDLGVDKDAEVIVLVYIDGVWQPIESVKNNSDGTLTCVFEDTCPVAFVMEAADAEVPGNTNNNKDDSHNPQTGDTIMRWVLIMVVCAAGIVIVTLAMKKRK